MNATLLALTLITQFDCTSLGGLKTLAEVDAINYQNTIGRFRYPKVETGILGELKDRKPENNILSLAKDKICIH